MKMIQKHPLASYFILAFAISWAGVLLVIGTTGIPGSAENTKRLFPFVYLAMLAGPSVAGVLMTGLSGGKGGLELLFRSFSWRVGVRWYAIALMTAPIVVGATLWALSTTSAVFRPALFTSADKASVLLFGIVVGMGAGIFEELGWTGFATPRIRRRRGPLSTGLIVGLLWGAWHMLAIAWGGLGLWRPLPPLLALLVSNFSFLPPYRVLMVRVNDGCGSLLVAMVMHTSLTMTLLVFGPSGISGMSLLIFDVALAGALWVVVAAVALADRRSLPRPFASLSRAGGHLS